MDPIALRPLGRTGLQVTALGLGTVPLGGARLRLSAAESAAMLEAAVDAGINYFDTAPWYGVGQAELHLGSSSGRIRQSGNVLSTKVGRVLFPAADPQHLPYAARWPGGAPNDLRFDYTRDGVLRSHEDSLRRLSVDRIDALVIHDLDLKFHQTEAEIARRLDELDGGGGFAALAGLKASGAFRAIGAGINQVGMIPRFLQRFDLDFFLVAMPYTLLDQPALDVDLPLCAQRGVSVVIGAPFCSGILAPGRRGDAQYGYRAPERGIIDKVERMEAVCARHGTSAAAAALQFPFGHPAVAAVIPGPESAQHVHANIALMRETIPPDLWNELKEQNLLRRDAPTP